MIRPLAVGPLAVPGHRVSRSGLRWLVPDGHRCEVGELLAFCTIAVVGADGARALADEARDSQIAFAAGVRGAVRRSPEPAAGGFLDLLAGPTWRADTVVGAIDTDDPTGEPLRLAFLAGRRATELAEDRSGLLTGWHDRTRAHWIGEAPPAGTLLGLGICELLGVFRGAHGRYGETLRLLRGGQVAHVPDDCGAPTVRTVLEQLRRTDAEREAIRSDLAATVAAGPAVPADWHFAGAIAAELGSCPLLEQTRVLSRGALELAGPPAAVVLSAHAEEPLHARHRALGFHWRTHSWRVRDAGPAVRRWMRSAFDPVPVTPEDVAEDYRALAAELRARTGARLLVVNRLVAPGPDPLVRYALAPKPLARNVSHVFALAIDRYLHELERDGVLAVVDQDAIAARIGLDDYRGVHATGRVQDAIRAELFRVAAALEVPGFS